MRLAHKPCQAISQKSSSSILQRKAVGKQTPPSRPGTSCSLQAAAEVTLADGGTSCSRSREKRRRSATPVLRASLASPCASHTISSKKRGCLESQEAESKRGLHHSESRITLNCFMGLPVDSGLNETNNSIILHNMICYRTTCSG